MTQNERLALAPKRVNVGCGTMPFLYWTNIDANTEAFADIYVTVPPLPFADTSLIDIYAGHFIEHLEPQAAKVFLAECFRCLAPGGRLGLVVPDTREIMARWLGHAIDEIEYPQGVWNKASNLDDVCRLFLYSTAQTSPHRWSYDADTLRDAIESAGFVSPRTIDRYRDERVTVGAWYQMGFDSWKPGGAQWITP